MESLVTKLKGSVDNDKLRKINEVKVTCKILYSNGKGPSGVTVETGGDTYIRKGREGIDVTNTYANSHSITNIQDGDVFFIYPKENYTRVRFTGDTNTLIKFFLEGVLPERFSEVTFNREYADLSLIPKSLSATQLFLDGSSSLVASYSDAVYNIDFKEIFDKYPNLDTINLGGNSGCIVGNYKNTECLLNVTTAKNATFNLAGVQLQDKKISMDDIKNFYNISVGSISGDYFGAINGKTKGTFWASGTFKYSGETFENSYFGTMGGNLFYVDGDVDLLLQNLANNANHISSGKNIIQISSYRTSASDAAISTLQSKGWTVTIPTRDVSSASANGIQLMSLSEGEVNSNSIGKYRIAYKDKELIVEPTEFPIYPADGVTVKEFMTLDEANEFISENNLSTDVE